uniref:Cell death abnormality protein 1-like n=1 Tax=Crassostrea virginica TaxID=6565 RepID=A0A8B8AI97_CRAVI|nr:cell death abnormality protein 1-like [Crassostrea virginica]
MGYLQISITILLTTINIIVSAQRCLSHTEDGECKDCFPGYVGLDCSHSCRYPNYGQGCQEICHCDETTCHAIRGCQQAIDCQPGYFGFNCIHTCRYPNFGVNCQHFCDCDAELCNKETGCELSTTVFLTSTKKKKANASSKVPFTSFSRKIHIFESSLSTRKLEVFNSSLPTSDVDSNMSSWRIVKEISKTTDRNHVTFNHHTPTFSDFQSPNEEFLFNGY